METKKLFIVCILINLLSAVFIIFAKNNIPPLVPLFYGLPIESEITSEIGLTIPALAACSFSILNLILAITIKSKFLEKIFLGITIITTLLSVITLTEIILLVAKF